MHESKGELLQDRRVSYRSVLIRSYKLMRVGITGSIAACIAASMSMTSNQFAEENEGEA